MTANASPIQVVRRRSAEHSALLSVYSTDRHFESTSDARIDLRCGSTVETQHPADPLDAFDGAR
jgi:hypothetical protein